VFAPGHLGELTRIVPFEMVDAVPAETGRTQVRVRVRGLPSSSALAQARRRVGVEPLKALFELLAGPPAGAVRWCETPGHRPLPPFRRAAPDEKTPS
jgi:hypothetical protein